VYEKKTTIEVTMADSVFNVTPIHDPYLLRNKGKRVDPRTLNPEQRKEKREREELIDQLDRIRRRNTQV
jgi:hypothetical protein